MLFGLATIPGVVVSTIVRTRQRQRHVNCQLERSKLRLKQLDRQGQILDRQLQLRDKERQEIESQIARLQSLETNLTDRINADRQEYQQLEQHLASLTLYCQEQQVFLTKLDRKIQEKQARSLEIDTNFNQLKLELAELQAAKIQTIDSIDRVTISLRNIQSEIERCAIAKQELELQIQQLQTQRAVDSNNLDRQSIEGLQSSLSETLRQQYAAQKTIEQQQLLLNGLDLGIANRQNTQQHLATEIDRLERLLAERSTELADRERSLVAVQLELDEAELVVKFKRSQLDELAAEILARNSEIESSQDYLAEKLQQRELKIAQLELSSRQAELDNLELKIQAKRQEIDDIDLSKNLQIFEPKPPIVSRDIDSIASAELWHEKFSDNPHLTVLQHIEKHGTITEAEASSKLGNARSVRQFANKLTEYAQDLPFSIRVESSPKGNRYLKETQS
jgi:chromosome segregation ATPase